MFGNEKKEKIPPNNNRSWYYKEAVAAAAADGRTFEKNNRLAVVKLVFTFTEREYYIHNIYIRMCTARFNEISCRHD